MRKNDLRRMVADYEDVFTFHEEEIVTLRDKDWEKIEEYFAIPEPIKEIEYQRIRLNRENEYHI